MSRQQRLALILAATAVAVIAFIALRPSDDSGEEADSTTQSAQTTPAETGQTATAPTAEAKPQPKTERIRVAGEKPVGGVKTITVDKGERVVITVSSSDTTDEVHLHGYDIEEPMAPGKPATFSFTAKIDGAYEMELHHDRTPIAELKVQP